MRKQVLKTDYGFNFRLLAVITPLGNYRLCWYFNRAFSCDFSREEDLEIWLPKKKRSAYFSVFNYYNPIDKLHIYVIENKYQNDVLVPELNQVDYFMMFKGIIRESDYSQVVTDCKSISHVQAAYNVDPLGLKSRYNLILDDTNF